MRRAALFALPLVVLGLYGCTQILSLDDAVIAPADSDSNVVLPIPDGVAAEVGESDVFDSALPDTTDAAKDVPSDSIAEAETKPVKDASPDD